MPTTPRTTPAWPNFRRRFQLGSTQRMVLEDAHGHYAGEVPLAVLHADNVQLDAPLATMPSTAMRRCWPTPTSWRS